MQYVRAYFQESPGVRIGVGFRGFLVTKIGRKWVYCVYVSRAQPFKLSIEEYAEIMRCKRTQVFDKKPRGLAKRLREAHRLFKNAKQIDVEE